MNKLFILLFASMFLFACSNDEQIPIENEDGLRFKVVLQDQINVRAGAPLYSQEALHTVADVKVYVFGSSSKTLVKMYDLTAEPEIAADQWASVDYMVPEADELPDGNYIFLAVGRSADAVDNYTLPTLTVGTTTVEDMIISIANSGDESELFAGTITDDITGSGTVTVNMTRKISGFLGYFTNIPAQLNSTPVHSIRLSVSAANKEINLQTGATNGFTPGAYDLINLDVSSQTVTANGVYAGNDLTAAGVTKLPNSQLIGGFMMPVTGVTMTLGLYDAGGAPLKEWTVVDGASTTINITPGGLFTLGSKGVLDSVFGENGVDNSNTGGGDDDKGIDIKDLLEHQTITVTIDPSWSSIKILQLQ